MFKFTAHSGAGTTWYPLGLRVTSVDFQLTRKETCHGLINPSVASIASVTEGGLDFLEAYCITSRLESAFGTNDGGG